MLEARLRSLIKIGRLTLITPGRRALEFGDAAKAPTLDVTVHVPRRSVLWLLGLNPAKHLPKAYVEGELIFERGSIVDLLELLFLNLSDQPHRPPSWLSDLGHAAQLWMLESRSRREARGDAILRHFTNQDVYQAFLGREDPQFSVAYFRGAAKTIEEGQLAARRHLASKLRLEPGQRILDLGCGWGGLAVWMAQTFHVEITAYTLSSEQFLRARDRISRAGLDERIRLAIGDHRDAEGHFDRILALGSFEHLGWPQYNGYFERIRSLLAPDGIALIQSTGRRGPPRLTNAWLRKIIFAGVHIPSLSELLLPIERAELWVTDLEVLRLHGAETARLWRQAFEECGWPVRDSDPELWRQWMFLLAAAEMGFRYGELLTFEAQLATSVTTTPLTRDYMLAKERRLAGEEPASALEAAGPEVPSETPATENIDASAISA